MNSELKIVETADGSKTIYNDQVGEHYHSRNGALQESEHVFLNAGLKHFLSINNTYTASILEVGFGTGLNFLLSAEYCTANKITLVYTGIEAYPLTLKMIGQTVMMNMCVTIFGKVLPQIIQYLLRNLFISTLIQNS